MSTTEYRDRVYIRKDIILKLSQYGSFNQTALLSYCGLNLQKHKEILDELEQKGLISKTEVYIGKKKVTEYKVTDNGIGFCRKILLPYESMFPRAHRRRVNKVTEPIYNLQVQDGRENNDK